MVHVLLAVRIMLMLRIQHQILEVAVVQVMQTTVSHPQEQQVLSLSQFLLRSFLPQPPPSSQSALELHQCLGLQPQA
jgi:hypothetical protein